MIVGIVPIDDVFGGDTDSLDACVFGALATKSSAATLAGTAKLKTSTTGVASYKLSKSVFVTPAKYLTSDQLSGEFDPSVIGFSATGAGKSPVRAGSLRATTSFTKHLPLDGSAADNEDVRSTMTPGTIGSRDSRATTSALPEQWPT